MNDIAYVLCGGNSLPNLFPATVRWANYLEAAVKVGPNVQKAGLKRLFYHNPGGHYYIGWTPNPNDTHIAAIYNAAKAIGVDTREMWINQWLLAESAGLKFADRNALKVGHQVLQYYGVEEVIYYVGGPDTVKSRTVEDCIKCVEMYLRCGDSASIGFDALGWRETEWTPESYIGRFIERIRKEGHKVYVEPRFSEAQIKMGLHETIDGTMAMKSFDDLYKIDYTKQPREKLLDALLTPKLAVEQKFVRPEGTTMLWRGNDNMNWQV